MTTTSIPNTIIQKVAAWREALLDGSRSNQLLYFKGDSSGRTASAVRIFGESEPFYARFVSEQKTSPERITHAMLGMPPLATDATPEVKEDYEKRLGTLIRRLKRLRERARDAASNRGITILYAACGILEWQESETGDEIIRSPLILIPIEIKPKGLLSDEFMLTRLNESRLVLNPTLREKLKSNFGIQLPMLTDDGKLADGDVGTLSAILKEVKDSVQVSRYAVSWQVLDEVYLGLFTFQRQALYDDLVEHASLVYDHPIIKAMCGEGTVPPPYDAIIPAEQLDQALTPDKVWQILDADASQQEAIIAARNGQSFVLQGPPGTGKSQTIANMIAECIAVGKRVLFVSEKMAAIGVVQKRLADAGLGAFYLNLHHRGTEKREKDRTYSGLKEALTSPLSATFQQHQWEDIVAQVGQTRRELNDYVHELHLRRLPLNFSAFEVYGKLGTMQATADIHCDLPDVAQMTSYRLADIERALKELSSYCNLFVLQDEHPWQAIRLREYGPATEASVRSTYSSLVSYLNASINTANHLGLVLIGESVTLSNAMRQRLMTLTTFALTTPLPSAHWLAVQPLEEYLAVAQTAAANQRQLTEAQRQFAVLYREEALQQDWPSYAQTLAFAEKSEAPAVKDGMDAFFADRATWSTKLTKLHMTLPILQTAIASIADACGFPQPRTLGEYGGLVSLTNTLADTPRPTAEWFDNATRRQAHKDAKSAATRYQRCAVNRATLLQTYDEGLFALDLAALHDRMQNQYASFLRLLLPSYYRDRAAVLCCRLSSNQATSYATLARDIALAAETVRLENELAAEAEERRERLGSLFVEESTNWDALEAQFQWTQTMSEILNEWEWEWTPQLRALIAQSKRRWPEFEVQHHQLIAAWGEWEPLAIFLQQEWDVARLLGKPVLVDVPIDLLQKRLSQMWQVIAPCWQIAEILAPYAQSGTTSTWQQLQVATENALIAQTQQDWLVQQHQQLVAAFGARFGGANTEWQSIIATLQWCREACTHFDDNTPPAAFIALVADAENVATREAARKWMKQLQTLAADLAATWQNSDAILPREVFCTATSAFDNTAYDYQIHLAQQKLDALAQLERWIAFLNCREKCGQLGLQAYLQALTRLLHTKQMQECDHAKQQTAWKVFEKRFYQTWLEVFTRNVPLLHRFRGEEHEQVIQRFQHADRAYLHYAQQRLVHTQMRVRQRLQEQMNGPATDEVANGLRELRRQVNMPRHKPLRKLIDLCGPAMRELMPCWMMSPLSVSEYIDPKKMQFDIVIFDEASQICAEDAISAIYRGRQLVVVGDENQLPPTNVFRKSLLIDDPDEEDDIFDAQRLESILAECAAALPSPRMLNFHYRSRHEALIAFSNIHFYAEKLVTFPSSQAEHRDGLTFVHVADGVYDRGSTRTNRREAERVAELVFEHVRHHSQQSLGVVAFSAAQQEAIELAIERNRRAHPEFEDWFKEEPDDAFFVRNLESVQGDERDVIILSVGYGRDAQGKMTQNFGPLNSIGGERRLNVAITRARRRMFVVASITAGDITGDSKGAQALRGYLDFAERGKAALNTTAKAQQDDRFDSPFEKEVCQALRAQGLLVDTQIGCSGYRIDLAIRDALHMDHYILGIECDGASYHSAKTARDRDRLRQQQLEALGWRIHRIWSRDWFTNPTREIEKIRQISLAHG